MVKSAEIGVGIVPGKDQQQQQQPAVEGFGMRAFGTRCSLISSYLIANCNLTNACQAEACKHDLNRSVLRSAN